MFNLLEDELRIDDASDPATCRRFLGAVISGPYAGSFMSDAAEESSLLGVHFKPGGAFALLGFPAGELANAPLDLKAAWGPAVRTLREQLCGLSQPAQRFRLLERFLLRKLFDGPDRHGAVGMGLDVLMRTHGREKIRDIARAVDLS